MNFPDPKPAVARTVIFVGLNGQHCPAIITRVNEETVDLIIFGEMNIRCSGVEFDETGTRERTWLWPVGTIVSVGERHVYRAGLTTNAPAGQLDLDPSSPEPAMQASASTIAAGTDVAGESIVSNS